MIEQPQGRFGRIEPTDIVQEFCEKSKVDQVSRGVGNASYVHVDGHPGVSQLPVEWFAIILGIVDWLIGMGMKQILKLS